MGHHPPQCLEMQCMGQRGETPQLFLVHTGVLSPQSRLEADFPAVFTRHPARSPRMLLGHGREAPGACRAAVPGKKAETRVFAALGSSNPAQSSSLHLIPIPTSQPQCWEGNPGEGSVPSWVDGQARAGLQRQREDGTSRVQLIPSQFLAKSSQLASPEL